jgi:hypothetical protein
MVRLGLWSAFSRRQKPPPLGRPVVYSNFAVLPRKWLCSGAVSYLGAKVYDWHRCTIGAKV